MKKLSYAILDVLSNSFQNNRKSVRFEVLTVALLKIQVFWDDLHQLINIYWRFKQHSAFIFRIKP